MFTASDGAMTDSEYVQITVIDWGNHPPVLSAIGPQTLNEGQSLSIHVIGTDLDGTIPSLYSMNLPANAIFTDSLNGRGAFMFSPNYFQAGAYSVLFIASDGLLADSELVAITVNNINRPPAITPIASPINIAEGDTARFVVISSDPDAEIPILTAQNLPLSNYMFFPNGDGTADFAFYPDYTQSGTYNIRFIATDPFAAADTEMVTINVSNVNQPPILAPIGPLSVIEGHTLNVVIRAADPDSTLPTFAARNLPRNSAFADSLNGRGLFTFSPDFVQAGIIDSVLFVATDGVLRDSEFVRITVIDAGNQPPVLNPIGPYTVNENEVLAFPVSAYDLDNTTPILSANHLPLNATFVDNMNGTGNFEFRPNANQAGSDTVHFFASDGSLIDSEYVVITVLNVNQAPILNPIGNRVMTEGDSLGIIITAFDPDANPIIMTTGALSPNMVFSHISSDSAYFGFKPTYIQSGTYNVLFRVSDSLLVDSEMVQIIVNDAGNQRPHMATIDTAYYVTEGDTLIINVSVTDPDGNTVVLSASPLATNMTFVDNLNNTGLFTFMPNYVQFGTYPLTVRAFDGSLWDSLSTVIHVAEQGNQPPILSPIGPRTVPEGDSLVINVSAIDPEGATPFLFVTSIPPFSNFTDNHNGTGRFAFHPDYYSAGVRTVRFNAMDNGGLIDFEDVQITITDVNRPPIIVFVGDTLVYEGDSLRVNVIVTDSTDAVPGQLNLSNGYMPRNSTFTITGNGTGVYMIRPDYNQAGVDSALFYASDNDSPPLGDQKWFRIHIREANRRPIFLQPPPGIVNQGETLIMNLSATDPDNDSLRFFINCSSCNPLIPARSSFVDNGNGTAQFIFNPDFTQTGIFLIYFAVTDGRATVTRPTMIQVIDMGNQIPVLNPIGPLSVIEGESLSVHITSSDPDSTPPAITLRGAPVNAVLHDSTNGRASFFYVPLYNQSGSYGLTFRATDPQGAIDSEIVSLNVIEAGNQRPQLSFMTNRTITEGQTLMFNVFASDPDSTYPRLAALNLPLNATFVDSLHGVGYFTFTPDFTQSGDYQITFMAIDSMDSTLTDNQIVVIHVLNYNRRPVFLPAGPFTVNEGEILDFNIVAADPDGQTPRLVSIRLPRNTIFTDNHNGTGSINFAPDFNQAGLDSIMISAIDSLDPTMNSMLNVRLNILDVNRPPVLAQIPDTTIGDGFLLNLPIVATDPDSTVPLLFHRALPDSSQFINNNNGTATFRWRPRFQDIGIYQITFGCIDRNNSSLVDSQVVTIQVLTAGNHPPVFNPIANQQLRVPDTLSLRIMASDLENDPLTISYEGVLPIGMVFFDSGSGAASLTWIPTMDQGGNYEITLVASDPAGLTDTARANIQVIAYIRGDANGSGTLNGLDVVYLVNYFKGTGDPPVPFEAGDANGDSHVNGLDVVYLVNYFKGGPPPPPIMRVGPGLKPGMTTLGSRN